jgi:hypothetical protein
VYSLTCICKSLCRYFNFMQGIKRKSRHYYKYNEEYLFIYICELNVRRLWFVQYEPTRCIIYFQIILVINFYMFRTGLLLIIRRYYSVYTASDICYELCWLVVGRNAWHIPIVVYTE